MGNIATSQEQFVTAYKAAQPAPVKALMAMDPLNPTAKQAEAANLAQAGYVIDDAIMVNNWDAWITTITRLQEGLTWTPSAAQLPLGQPGGIALPGVPTQGTQTAYNPKVVPAGAIVVTLDLDILAVSFPAPKA